MRTSFISVLFLSVFIGFTPVVFYGWLFFLRRKKRFQQGKQPTALLSMMFLGGIAAVVFAFFAERYLIQFLPQSFSFCVAQSPLCQTASAATIGVLALATFLIVAPLEEGFKFLAVYFISIRSPQFTRIIDGAKYGIAVALGFASAENALYLFTSLRELDLNTFVSTFLLRFALSSPAHLFYSGLFGYYLGRAQFTRYGRGRLIATGLTLAIVTHGLYDFVLFSRVGFYAIFLLVALFGVLYFVFKSPENFAVRIPEFMRRHPSSREKFLQVPPQQGIAPAYQGLRPILAEISPELRPITPQNLKPEYLPKEVPSEFAEQPVEQPVRGEIKVPISTVPVRSIKTAPALQQLTARPRALGPVPERTADRAARVMTKRIIAERERHQRFTRSKAASVVDRSVAGIKRRRLNVLPA
ncbi:MAG: PrsW family intramembrane metalloprotease [Candidatus Andersenbacteria bacterium]